MLHRRHPDDDLAARSGECDSPRGPSAARTPCHRSRRRFRLVPRPAPQSGGGGAARLMRLAAREPPDPGEQDDDECGEASAASALTDPPLASRTPMARGARMSRRLTRSRPHDVHARRAHVPAPASGSGHPRPPTGRAPWWRHLAVILLLAAADSRRVLLCGVGPGGALLVLTDLRRHPYTRLGSALVVACGPLSGALERPAAHAVRDPRCAAGGIRDRPRRSSDPTGAGRSKRRVRGAAATLAILHVAPVRTARAALDKQAALTRRSQPVDPRSIATLTVVSGRAAIRQRPLYLVLLFEPNPTRKTTGTGNRASSARSARRRRHQRQR